MKHLFIISLILCICSSCYKDYENKEVIEIIIEAPKDEKDTGLIGQVFDGADALSGYSINVNGQETPVSGQVFSIQLQRAAKEGQLIEVTKDKHLIGMAYSYLLEDDLNKIEIPVLQQFSSIEFQSGTNLLESEQPIEISYEDSFLDSNGNEVVASVDIDYLLIEDEASLASIANAGHLRTGELVALQPSAVYLLDIRADGSPVHKKEDALVDINIDAYSGQTLFGFHRVFNYWVELGTLDGTAIQSPILDHFIVADYLPAVYTEGVLIQEDTPVAFARGVYNGSLAYDFITTEKGQWAGVFPQNENLAVEVYNPCNELVQSATFETTTTDNLNARFDLDIDIKTYSIAADIIDCNAQLSNQPSLVVEEKEQQEIYVFSTGVADHALISCSTELAVSALDLAAGATGPQLNWTTEETESINYLSACAEDKEGYSYIKIREDMKAYDVFQYEYINGETVLSSNDNGIRFRFDGDVKGSYPEEAINVYIRDVSFGQDGYYFNCEESSIGCGITQFEVTHYDEQGEGWLRIVFAGKLWMQTIENFKVGDFDIEGVILIKT